MVLFLAGEPAPLVAGGSAMLYVTAVLTLAALIYLGYAMIRPERF
jgi:K+-transporting ATPase KdpF subunit